MRFALRHYYKAGARLYRSGGNRGHLKRWLLINELTAPQATAVQAGFEDERRVNPDPFIASLRSARLGNPRSKYNRKERL